jgi:hypothetical protein
LLIFFLFKNGLLFPIPCLLLECFSSYKEETRRHEG